MLSRPRLGDRLEERKRKAGGLGERPEGWEERPEGWGKKGPEGWKTHTRGFCHRHGDGRGVGEFTLPPYGFKRPLPAAQQPARVLTQNVAFPPTRYQNEYVDECIKGENKK